MITKKFNKCLMIALLFSVISIKPMDYESDDETPGNNERETQKALVMLAGSSVLLLGSHFLADKFGFAKIGDYLNVDSGQFRQACALSTTFSALGVISDPKWAGTFRSIAWRLPLMSVLGGVLSHPKLNESLAYAPLGLGTWFKENPPVGKPGIQAIYNIGAWYMVKPSLDKLERMVQKTFAKK